MSCGHLTGLRNLSGVYISNRNTISSERGKGTGAQIVQFLEECARRAEVHHLVLHPHFYLERFYHNLGYQTIPASDSTVGQHRLIAMEKWLVAEGRQDDKMTRAIYT